MSNIIYASSIWKKFRGLMGKKELLPDEGLYLPYCEQVHTAFMKFPIDVVFVDIKGRVLEIEEQLIPWRISKKVAGAVGCLEMLAGEVKRQGIKKGEKFISI